MARNYSCGYSDLLCGSTTESFFTTLADGTVAQFGLLGAITCTSGTQNACSGQPTGTNGAGFSYSWLSRAPSIASISGPSTNATISLQGMSSGSTNVPGLIRSQYCSSGGNPPVTVEACPTSVSVHSNTTISITDNTSLHTGYGDMVSMLVSPAAANSSSYKILESVTPGTNSCPFTVFPTITQATSGTFDVGSAAVLTDNSNIVYQAIPNAFYDEISVKNTISNLPANKPNCTATATHNYYCGGTQLGTFTDMTTITHGTANGGPASIVLTTQQ
jgi:hypothetical protein